MADSDQDNADSQQPNGRLTMDATGAVPVYANMCRVASTPEEVILDLAMNPEPLGAEDIDLKVSQRVILNHFTAKRLAILLGSALQQHESIFGNIETDVRKRAVNQPE